MKWTQKEIDFLLNNYGNIPVLKISKLINRSTASICFKSRELNLKSDSMLKRVYTVNDNFFTIPNTINAYWAGFLAADGNIKKNKNCIRLKISIKDLDVIKNLIAHTEFTGTYKIAKIGSGYGNENNLCVTVDISSRKWKKDLGEIWNIFPKKTYNLLPPILKEKSHIACYLVGYIDGDGCICQSTKYSIKCILLGTQEICLYYKEFLDKEFPSSSKNISNIIKINNTHYTYSFASNRLKKFYKYIKQFNLPLLQRKWSKLEQ